jgi:NTE family protein
MTLEQQAQHGLGADLVLEGGGVKGIGLVGAVLTLHKAGYVFPRVGGTSAGAIVAALIAAYQTRGVDLSQVERDMRELDYTQFMEKSWAEKHLGPIGKAESLIARQGVYATGYLTQWLTAKLDPLGIRTFADLKITDDDDTGLPPRQRYRLVTHTSDLSRRALVRLPWDLPYYLLRDPDGAPLAEQIAVIDSYLVVDAVRASMSIPYFFEPFLQTTVLGSCTWVDGGLLQNFPVTVFDRTDGQANRWPTFGVKLMARPLPEVPDVPVAGDLRELAAVAHTAIGEWNRYPLADQGVGARTVYVDTMKIPSTDFGLSQEQKDRLFENGRTAAAGFLAAWNAAHPRVPAPRPGQGAGARDTTVTVTSTADATVTVTGAADTTVTVTGSDGAAS